MNKRQREVLRIVMEEIIREEKTMGNLVVIENVLECLSTTISSKELKWAINYMNEHCAIYFPKVHESLSQEGYLYRF